MRKSGLNFTEVLDVLRDGKSYRFATEGMKGYFFKAPFPAQEVHTKRDGAASAITYWENGKLTSPTLMLYDFDIDEGDWSIEQNDWPVGLD